MRRRHDDKFVPLFQLVQQAGRQAALVLVLAAVAPGPQVVEDHEPIDQIADAAGDFGIAFSAPGTAHIHQHHVGHVGAQVAHELGSKAIALKALGIVGHGQAHGEVRGGALVAHGKVAGQMRLQGLNDKVAAVALVAHHDYRPLGVGRGNGAGNRAGRCASQAVRWASRRSWSVRMQSSSCWGGRVSRASKAQRRPSSFLGPGRLALCLGRIAPVLQFPLQKGRPGRIGLDWSPGAVGPNRRCELGYRRWTGGLTRAGVKVTPSWFWVFIPAIQAARVSRRSRAWAQGRSAKKGVKSWVGSPRIWAVAGGTGFVFGWDKAASSCGLGTWGCECPCWCNYWIPVR